MVFDVNYVLILLVGLVGFLGRRELATQDKTISDLKTRTGEIEKSSLVHKIHAKETSSKLDAISTSVNSLIATVNELKLSLARQGALDDD